MKPNDTDMLAACDPGIRRVVAWLRARDFETTDSGDGVSKPGIGEDHGPMDVPHVFMRVPAGVLVQRAKYLQNELRRAGFTPRPGRVQASYDPADDVGLLALVGIDDSDLDAPA